MAEAEVFKFGDCRVTLRKRSDGFLIASWWEDGKIRKSSRADTEKTRAWAQQKARELGSKSGKRWVSPAQADRLDWLEKIAGNGADAGRVLADVEEAMAMLGGRGSLREAARFFVEQTPRGHERLTLAAAVKRFLKDYETHHPRETVSGPKSELGALAVASGALLLREVDAALLTTHTRRGAAAVRTVRNRVAYWILFFNWCRDHGIWPEGRKSPAALMKRPKKETKSPKIFTPADGKVLWSAVAKEYPQHVSYALLAGWLGLRPTECVRVTWDDVDWRQGLLHVRAEVAKKVARERWVPLTPAAVDWLRWCQEMPRPRKGRMERICRLRAQVDVSRVAREAGLVWSIDVLRHSRITYRLQETRDIGLVAEESGNSPGEIRASYKRPVPPGEWEKWEAVIATAPGQYTTP